MRRKRTSPYMASPNGYPYYLDSPPLRELQNVNIRLYAVVSRTVENIEQYESAVKSGNAFRVASAITEILLNARPEDFNIMTMMDSPTFGLFGSWVNPDIQRKKARAYDGWQRKNQGRIYRHQNLLEQALELIQRERALPGDLLDRIQVRRR